MTDKTTKAAIKNLIDIARTMPHYMPMKISYVNGEFVDHSKAVIPLEDRSYLFSDGVYEVIEVVNRKLIDAEGHFSRLETSLAGIRIKEPMPIAEIENICHEIISRNNAENNFIYIQISRGAAKRTHQFPVDANPILVIYLLDGKKPSEQQYAEGVSIITTEETRWKYRNFKTVSLLPNILAKQSAAENKAFEAWFVEDDGTITEGSSTNAYIIKNNIIITHPATHKILCGVTRNSLLKLAASAGIKVEQRPFSLAEAMAADECFLSSTSCGALAVTEIDGKPISNRKPGEISKKLHELYKNYVTKIAHTTETEGRSVRLG